MKELSQLGPFTLLGKIGEGGMGAVYKARDSRLNRVVAIKLLPLGDRRTSDQQAGADHRGPGAATAAPFIYSFQDSRLMAMRFDAKARRFG